MTTTASAQARNPAKGLPPASPQRNSRCGSPARAADSAAVAAAPVRRLVVASTLPAKPATCAADRRGGCRIHPLRPHLAADQQRDPRAGQAPQRRPIQPRRCQPGRRHAVAGAEDGQDIGGLPRRGRAGRAPAGRSDGRRSRAACNAPCGRPAPPATAPPAPARRPAEITSRGQGGRISRRAVRRQPGQARPGPGQPGQRAPGQRHDAERHAQPFGNSQRLRRRAGPWIGQTQTPASVMDAPPRPGYGCANRRRQRNAPWPCNMPPIGTGTPR